MNKNKGQNIKIDKLLKKIEKSGNYTFNYAEFLDEKEPTEYSRLILFMTEIKLLREIKASQLYLVITELGFEVLSKGGWIKYLNSNNIKKNISLSKDLVLTIIPILSLLTTMYIAIYFQDKGNLEKNKIQNIETKKISNQLIELKTDLKKIEMILNKLDSIKLIK